jgi:transcriptional regulator with XRE-family HTH domain
MRDKDSMNSQNRPDDGAPAARLEFARRLRELRIPRGFRTARSLARSLDIDENRYTRYERAEVEPDLTMIRRICETLNVTPNDLFSYVGVGAETQSVASAGARSLDRPGADAEPRPVRPQNDPITTAAWLVAEVATQLKGNLQAKGGAGAPRPTALAIMAETGRLYKALMEQPFETITDLLSEQAVANADPDIAQPLQDRIEAFVALIKSPS